MERVRYNDKYIYVDDSPLDEKETGVFYRDKNIDDELENTIELKTISNSSVLANTNIDLWGRDNE